MFFPRAKKCVVVKGGMRDGNGGDVGMMGVKNEDVSARCNGASVTEVHARGQEGKTKGREI